MKDLNSTLQHYNCRYSLCGKLYLGPHISTHCYNYPVSTNICTYSEPRLVAGSSLCRGSWRHHRLRGPVQCPVCNHPPPSSYYRYTTLNMAKQIVSLRQSLQKNTVTKLPKKKVLPKNKVKVLEKSYVCPVYHSLHRMRSVASADTL